MAAISSSTGRFDSNAVKAELNQYWYSPNTIQTMIAEVLHHATSCAFLSTPSLFFALDARRGDEDEEEEKKMCALRQASRVFEYDAQWSSDPGYVFYDFHKPDQIPVHYLGAFDYILADPPFITADVWANYIITAKLLLKDGGKLFFTTVLENHTMLEGLINGPLFIPRFRPCVMHLTYQYVCFLSYEATMLQQKNAELEDEDPKLLVAIQMANDIRSSETAFAQQMAERNRLGEEALSTTAYERDLALAANPELRRREEEEKRGQDLATMPIEKMEWGYIPEGLSMYPEGQTREEVLARQEQAAEVPAEHYGPAYTARLALRAHLESFKNKIDAMQRHMDAQMKLRHQRVRLHKELAAATAPSPETEAAVKQATAAINESEATRAATLADMEALASLIISEEQQVAQQDGLEVNYAGAMRDCVEAYRRVEAKKNPLQELAAEATGKYKFPIFNRMKELLQEMKEIKKQQAAASA